MEDGVDRRGQIESTLRWGKKNKRGEKPEQLKRDGRRVETTSKFTGRPGGLNITKSINITAAPQYIRQVLLFLLSQGSENLRNGNGGERDHPDNGIIVDGALYSPQCSSSTWLGALKYYPHTKYQVEGKRKER